MEVGWPLSSNTARFLLLPLLRTVGIGVIVNIIIGKERIISIGGRGILFDIAITIPLRIGGSNIIKVGLTKSLARVVNSSSL